MEKVFRLLTAASFAAGLSAILFIGGCTHAPEEAKKVEVNEAITGYASDQARPQAGPQAQVAPSPSPAPVAAGAKEQPEPMEAPAYESGHRRAEGAPAAAGSYAIAPPPAAQAVAPPAPPVVQKRADARRRMTMKMPAGDGPGDGLYYAPAPTPGTVYEHQPPPPEYFGRDNFEHKDVNPVKVVAEEPVSTFSIDVDTTSYSFVRKSLSSGHLPQKDAVRVEEMINYFDYAYEVPRSSSKPFRPTVAVYPTPWNPDTKLLHIGIKGLDIAGRKKPRANLVFLIDVSGSMSSQDKLPLVKNSLRLLVDSLGPEDTIGIVVYAGAAGTVLEPTKAADKGRILAALERLHAGGSTAGAEGIRQAYALAEANYDKKAVNRVILATDGDFNVGITNPEELKGFIERKRESGVYLSVLGFGMGNYNDQMMQKLAQNGNGNAAYIDTLNEARKVLVNEAGSTIFTIAKDVKIQVEFNPSRVAEYRLIGYETRMLSRADFNNDAVDAGDVGSGRSVTAIYEITPAESGARLVDDLRYGSVKKRSPKSGDEYAFLKIRYKLPDEDESRLIKTPIGRAQEYRSVKDVPSDLRFAASVAAFGQLLRGTPFVNGFGCEDILSLARPARGDDPFGYRGEFISLVTAAKGAGAMPEQPWQ